MLQIQQETADFLELWCNKGLVSVHSLCVKTFHYLLATSLHKRTLVSTTFKISNAVFYSFPWFLASCSLQVIKSVDQISS
jgi:hypothetical protein